MLPFSQLRSTFRSAIGVLLALSALPAIAAQPLKVYILAGQSNMQGHAKVETFDYLGDDPATAPLLREMRGPEGKPHVCENVWISYLTGARGEVGEASGKLTAGYGARRNPTEDGGKIGPEFTFGITMDKVYDGPILLIKTAWGGKSLHTDFRSPSAGPYAFSESHLEALKKKGKDVEQVKADKSQATGHYYRLMIDHVKKVLAAPERVVPEYDEAAGYEIAGFVWFQGWNDKVDSKTYPQRREAGGYRLYSELLAHLIRDVRKDLATPQMPFVIGVMGVGGIREQPEYFRQAMAAPAALPEFQGNVVAVPTAPFWDKPLADLAEEMGVVSKAAYYLRKKEPSHVKKDPVAAAILDKYIDQDGTMNPKQIRAFMQEYRAARIGPEKEALWKRGASNAGYHYLGCAKTMALIGQAFGNAMLKMETK